jgi:hypothetical protein
VGDALPQDKTPEKALEWTALRALDTAGMGAGDCRFGRLSPLRPSPLDWRTTAVLDRNGTRIRDPPLRLNSQLLKQLGRYGALVIHHEGDDLLPFGPRLGLSLSHSSCLSLGPYPLWLSCRRLHTATLCNPSHAKHQAETNPQTTILRQPPEQQSTPLRPSISRRHPAFCARASWFMSN